MSKPIVTFNRRAACSFWDWARPDTDAYEVTFDYHRMAVETIKSAVPSYARSFDPDTKVWSVRTQWAGVLMFALRGAGFRVDGLDEAGIEDWFAPFVAPLPTSEAGRCAYLKGICRTCKRSPYRPGGVECRDCFHGRFVRQYRVRRVLAEAGLAPWPKARPAQGSAWGTHMPIEIFDENILDPNYDTTGSATHDEAIANIAAVLGSRVVHDTHPAQIAANHKTSARTSGGERKRLP